MLISEIKSLLQEDAKKNFDRTYPAKSLQFSNGSLVTPDGKVPLTKFSCTQLCQKAGIPQGVMDFLLEKGRTEFHAIISREWEAYGKAHDQVLLRLRKEEGRVFCRAVLSDCYGIIDNYPTFQAIEKVLPKVAGIDNFEFQKPVLSDKGMSLVLAMPLHNMVANSPAAKEAMARDELHRIQLRMNNSEVGMGSYHTSGGIERAKCANLALWAPCGNGWKVRVVHKGNKGEAELSRNVYNQLANTLAETPAKFAQYWGLNQIALEAPKDQLINIADRIGLGKRNAVKIGIENLPFNVRETGSNVYSLLQAITSFAKSQEAAKQQQLQEAAGRILTLSPDQWRVVA